MAVEDEATPQTTRQAPVAKVREHCGVPVGTG